MKSSYFNDDVTLLLKDITGMVEPQSAEEREKLIQSGKHYCEMLPIEYKPTGEYMRIYHELLDTFAQDNADAVRRLAMNLYLKFGENLVLVSLARAGTPVGILLRRYLKYRYGADIQHYSISIIRGRGIDKNAVNHIMKHHPDGRIVFVDGWTGKGAIHYQLCEALKEFPIAPRLAVLADPAGVADFYGTREDLLVPSCCLNSTVCGLISRTFLRDDIIGENDYHGAVYYGELKDHDLSYDFINKIESCFDKGQPSRVVKVFLGSAIEEVTGIAQRYDIKDINLVKPSLGEATRVLLRRVPWKILIQERYKDSKEIQHILRLAEEKGVEVEYTHLAHYIAVGLIKELSDV